MSNEELVSEIQRGHNVKNYLSQLYLQNEPMLQKTARGFLGNGEELDDLVNTGWIGMQKAVNRYDPDAGASFLTYSLFWVRQEIIRYQKTCGHLVRLPEFRQDQVIKYRKFLKDYNQQNGCDPDRKTVREALKVSDHVLRSIEKADRMQNLRSLSEPVSGADDSDEMALGDFIASTESVSDDITDKVLTEDIQGQIRAVLDALEENQRAAVIGTVMECKTLKDVGKDLGLSYQRIAQLRDQALDSIRQSESVPCLGQCYSDLYSLGLRGTGLSKFKNTGTSSTEAAALRLLEMKSHQEQVMGLTDDLQLIKLLIIKKRLRWGDEVSVDVFIRDVVPDPDLQDILIRMIVHMEKASKVIMDYDDLERLHKAASELKKSIVRFSRS